MGKKYDYTINPEKYYMDYFGKTSQSFKRGHYTVWYNLLSVEFKHSNMIQSPVVREKVLEYAETKNYNNTNN